MMLPPEHWLFHSEPSVVAKQPAGTPENAEPAAKTSGYSAARTLVIMAPEEKPLTHDPGRVDGYCGSAPS